METRPVFGGLLINRQSDLCLLDKLAHDGELWEMFATEVFHHAVRVCDITEGMNND